MKKYSVFLVFLFLAAISLAAAPNKETNQMILFTDRNQSTTTNFKINTIAWTSSPGSTSISTGCDVVLTDAGDSTDILRLSGTNQTVAVGGLNVNGINCTNTQGVWCGKVYIYGQRR